MAPWMFIATLVAMVACGAAKDVFLPLDEPFFFRNPQPGAPHVRHTRRAVLETDCFIPTTLWFIAEGTEIFTRCEVFVCSKGKIVSKGRQTCCELNGVKIEDTKRHFIDCVEHICKEGVWVKSEERDPECCTFEDAPYQNGDTLPVGCGATECAEGRWLPSTYTQGFCKCGRVYGDPHLQTFDGEYYDWQLRCNHTVVQVVSPEEDIGRTHDPETAVYSHFVDCGAIYRQGPACVATSVFRDTPNSIFTFHKGVATRVWHNSEELNLEPNTMMKVAGALVWMVPGGIRVQGTSAILVEYHALGTPSVSVWVPPALRGRVEGLLGNFDDLPDNDIQRGRHGPANSLPFFAGSWMAKDQPDPKECKNPDLTQVEENLCQLIPPKERRRLRNLCRERLSDLLSSSSKTRGHQLESCLQDMCACRNEAECLQDIADEMENQKTHEEFALQGCTFEGKFYESNTTREMKCRRYICDGSNWVLVEKQSEKCCVSKGALHQEKSETVNSCLVSECSNGRWRPTDKIYGKCGKCRAYDDPHFTTFDGRAYDWHVRCNFTLVQINLNEARSDDGGVENDEEPIDTGVENEEELYNAVVFSEFEDCSANYKTGPACVATTVFKDTNTSVFSFRKGVNDKVWHNGQEHLVLGKTVLELGGATVWAVPGGLRVHGASSLLVEFYSKGSSAVSVWAPPKLSGKVAGLCGDFDGSGDNDFKDLSPFASSWMAEEQKVDCQPPQGDNPQMNLCAEVDKHIISGYYRSCEDKLKTILSKKTEVGNHQLESCVQDLCVCNDPEKCLGDVVEVTANEALAEALTFNGCVWEEVNYNNGSQNYIQCQLYVCVDGEWMRQRGTDPTCCRFNEATYEDNTSLTNICDHLVCRQGRWEVKDEEVPSVPETVDDETYSPAALVSVPPQTLPTVPTTTTPKPILPPDDSFCKGVEVRKYEVDKTTLAGCPGGWLTLGKEDIYCLVQPTTGQSWKDADLACQEMNATLADLSSPEQFEAVREYLKGSGASDVWVGATNWKQDLKYKWAWVSTSTGVSPSMWGRNANRKSTSEQCMALAKDRNYMGAEKPCTLSLPFICSSIQRDPPCPVGFLYIEGGCYSVTTSTAAKTKAEESCKDIGASLAIFDSVAKWKAVGDYITTSYGQVKPEYWVDGQRSENPLSEYWRWSNKKAIDPSLWDKGDDFTVGHNCLALSTAKQFTALDFPCKASKAFICETQPAYFVSKKHPLVMCPNEDSANEGCGESWQRVGKECYTLPPRTETWDQAKKSCESYGGSIAVFTQTSELKIVKSYLKILDSDTVWIGATNSMPDLKYMWVWINSVVVQNDVWEIGDPKKKTTGNLCLALQKGTSAAVEMACNIRNRFLCHKKVNSRACPTGWMYAYGSCFRFSSDKKKWEDACWTTNSALATFHNLNQWKALQSVMARSANLATSFWVGASSDTDEHSGEWVWTTGAKVDHSLWKPANPFEDASRCMYMDGTRDFKMGDYTCASVLNYVCQIKPLFYVDNDKKPVITDSMAGCPHGWKVIGQDCYYLANSTHYTDWNNAQRTCHAYHGTLATFTNEKKFLEVHDYLKRSEHPSTWVGGTNGLPDLKYTWVWVDGVLVNVDAWAPGKPTLKTSVGCMVLWSTADYLLQDIACSYKYSFICRKEQTGRACPHGWLYVGGSCLQKSTNKKSWENARLTCNSNNFNLAVLNSPQLWNAFQSSMAHSAKPDASYWVGASDTLSSHLGKWTWLSGARVHSAVWKPANPFEYNSHCMYMDSGKDFLMGDYTCATALNYVCQREPNYYIDEDVPIKASQSIDYMTGCPRGWNRIGQHCYYLADKVHYTNWNNAKLTCNSYHATLATFHNTSELQEVKEHIDIKDNIWIGATNGLPHLKYHWVWVNNALVDHSFWTNDRPKAKSSVNCMALWAATTHLPVDVACTNTYSFLCRKGVEEPACPDGWFYAQGSCFMMSGVKKNWDQANETCGQAGTSLASFYDRNQWHTFQSAMARSAHLPSSYWVGAKDDFVNAPGQWSWLHGAPVDYSVWKPANPFEDTSHCMYLDGTREFHMGDYTCTSALYYICQRDPLRLLNGDRKPVITEIKDCPYGWERIGSQCYFLADRTRYTDWNNAYRTCRAYHGYLATFKSSADIQEIRQYVDGKDVNVWVGATNSLVYLKYHWVWINYALVDAAVWAEGWPKSKSSLHCMALWASNGHFPADVACTYKYAFLCRVGSEEPACPRGWTYARGSCFWFSNVKKNWNQARLACGEQGTSLAVLPDLLQWRTLQSSMARAAHLGTTYWVGAADNLLKQHIPQWNWLSGTRVDYTVWKPANPFEDASHCMYMDGTKKFFMGDYTCTTNLNYVCQMEPLRYLYNEIEVHHDVDTMVDCPHGWNNVSKDCLYIASAVQSTDWSNAHRTCQAFHATLATYHDHASLVNTQQFLMKKEQSTAWIGASNSLPDLKHRWVWVDGVLVKESLWSTDSLQSKNSLGCMALWNTAKYEPRDIACTYKYPYICKKENLRKPCPDGWLYVKGACLHISPSKKSWSAASLACNNGFNASLAVFDDLKVYQEFRSSMARGAGAVTSYWVGAANNIGKTPGQWTWISGAQVAYSVWKPANPFEDSSHCMYMDGAREFYMGDQNCATGLNYVCQKDPKYYINNDSPPVVSNLSDRCPPGWMLIGNECYYISNEKQSTDWNNAYRTCHAFHATLATFTNESDLAVVEDYLSKTKSPNIWIGATNSLSHLKHRWVWVNNELVDVSMWPEDRPKAKSSLLCMALWAATSHLPVDIACTNKYPFLCKRGVEELVCPNGWMYAHGSCFFMSTSTTTWANAKQDCGNRRSTLATFQDMEQWRAFQSSMAQAAHLATSYWVGGANDIGENHGYWVWLNGIHVDYSVWKPANAFEDTSHCMYMDGVRNFLMGDYSCASALYYVCQKEPLQYLRNDTAPSDEEDSDWSVTCPDGWIVIGKDCYYLADSSHHTDWNNARRTCNAYHATLATFENARDLSPVSQYLSDIKSSNVWVGASNNVPHKLIWAWVNNALVNVSVWPKDRPKTKSSYNCMSLWATTSHLPVDVACTYTYSFLCRRGIAGPACPDGWMYASGSCFQINNVGRNWADARHDCSSKKTTLAVFDTVKVLSFLQSSMIRGSHGATPYWVGAASDLDLYHGSWTWLSGSKVLPSMWTPANAFSSSEKCMYVDPAKQFTFNDQGCGSRLNYMCQHEPLYYLDGDTKPQPKPYIDNSTGCPAEWVKVEQECYYVSDKEHATDWNNAVRTCAAFHGTLAIFSNETQIENVRKYLKLEDSLSVWVGASNTLLGSQYLWLWLDHSAVENSIWFDGYPKSKESQMCMVLWKTPSYESKDISCTLKYPFICSQPVRKLICPEKWFFIHNSCFFMSTVTKNWNDANLDCDKSGSSLAVLDTPVAFRRIVRYLAKTAGKASTSYWIGATSDLPSSVGQWTWINRVKVSKEALPVSSPPTAGAALLLDGTKSFDVGAAPKTNGKHYICQQRIQNPSLNQPVDEET